MITYFYKIGIALYVYCTDFTINLANLTGLSYYEISAFIFCVIWPVVTILLILIFIFLKIKLKYLRSGQVAVAGK